MLTESSQLDTADGECVVDVVLRDTRTRNSASFLEIRKAAERAILILRSWF